VTATLPTGAAKAATVRAMFDTIAPRYDLVNRVMTFGLDVRWRRSTVRALGLPPGSLLLDVACGTGDLSRIAAAAGLRVAGVDVSLGMLRAAPPGPAALQADALALPVGGAAVDGITCGFALRNVADLDAALREMARVLRPGGRLALLEVDEPDGALLRTGHKVWFEQAVPRIGALLSDAEAYRYLPRSVAYLPSPARLRAMVRRAGFSCVGRRPLGGGVAQLITATRAGAPEGPGAGSREGGRS